MLGLRQEVGSDERCIGIGIGNDAHLRRSGGHIYCNIVETHLLLGCHHVLVARSEYLIHLGYRFSAVGHGSDGLHSACLEDMAHSRNAGSNENGRIHLTLAVGRSTEHNLAATGYLGRSGEHEHGAEQRCCAARDIKSHLVDGNTLLPTGDSGTGAHLMTYESLRLMEGADIVVGQLYGGFQVVVNKALGLVHLCLTDCQ